MEYTVILDEREMAALVKFLLRITPSEEESELLDRLAMDLSEGLEDRSGE